MRTLFFSILLTAGVSACLLAGDAAPRAAGTAAEPDPRIAAAAIRETAAADILYEGLVRWDDASVSEIARVIPSLPEHTAVQALWLAAAAPPKANAGRIFDAALSSPSALVRSQAADILASLSLNSPDNLAKLLGRLAHSESDSSVLLHLVSGMGTRPHKAAVQSLMQVMLTPGLKPAVAAAAATELRRLTRASLSDKPEAWRDWWRENQRQYR